MKKERADRLRQGAENQLEARGGSQAPTVDTAANARLLHELEVHRIELETQNEELLRVGTELEQSLELYTELFDFAPVGYALVRKDSTIAALNFACARLFGRERRELVGKRLVALVDTLDQDVLAAALHRTLIDDEAPTTCELSCLERTTIVEARILALAPSAREARALVALVDVTARKQLDGLRAEEARRKDAFLGALSHELRNPLAPIRSGLLVLDRVREDTAEAREARSILHRQVDHLTRIVEDLLDVTRLTSGKLVLRAEVLDLREAACAALADHRLEIEANGIALAVNIGDDPVAVRADPTRLSQVIGNLLVNARKFTPRGGHVVVSVSADRELAILSVRDDGVGIDPPMRETIFEPFTQAPQSLDRSSGGLGLGLAMVEGLVDLHDGKIEVRSEGLGRGSEFIVRLPRVDTPVKVAAPVAPRKSAPRRVLLIDDNTDLVDAMGLLLRLEGHDVRVAYEGQAGIDEARTFLPEIVFCDIGLPDVDGYEVARVMRANPTLVRTYLVALSGYTRSEDRAAALAAGFDCHLPKPPRMEEVVRAIADAPPAAAA